MGSLRAQKVQELIKQEISKIILRDIKDPRVGFVTVTKVKMTSDLRSARIFLSLLGSEEEKKACWEGLSRSIGYMRHEIGQRVHLRYTPELTLEIDDTLEYGAHIQKLLRGIEEGEKS